MVLDLKQVATHNKKEVHFYFAKYKLNVLFVQILPFLIHKFRSSTDISKLTL